MDLKSSDRRMKQHESWVDISMLMLFNKRPEAIVRRHSSRQVFLRLPRNLLENTCVGVFFTELLQSCASEKLSFSNALALTLIWVWPPHPHPPLIRAKFGIFNLPQLSDIGQKFYPPPLQDKTIKNPPRLGLTHSFPMHCKVFWCLQRVEKGCIGNEWVNQQSAFEI